MQAVRVSLCRIKNLTIPRTAVRDKTMEKSKAEKTARRTLSPWNTRH